MDYEKKYKDALERASKYNFDDAKQVVKDLITYIFPELKESEDEKIRKWLISQLKIKSDDTNFDLNIMIDKAISWLEKQGEQKPIKMWHDVSEVPDEMQELLVEWESPDATWHDIAFYNAETKAFRHLKHPINNVTRWAYVSDILSQSVTKTSEQGWSDTLERQGEKKPFDYENANIQQKDFAPKVEPFDKYEGLTDFERTLADICIGWIGEELGWKQYIKDNADVLLKIAIEKFNSVQDASFEQKPAWSEEDETKMRSALAFIKSEFPKKGNEEIMKDTIAWLKSLKHQNTWKPSKEQIEALHDLNLTGDISYMGQARLLIELYNDLKKLTE